MSALEARRPEVLEEDRRWYAAALRAGEKEPAPTALKRFEDELVAARRRAEGFAMAVSEAEAELVAAVDSQRASWAAELDKTVAAHRTALAEAVEALVAARDRLAESLTVCAWLDGFPRTTKLITPLSTSQVPGLVGMNGDTLSWGGLVDVLRRFAEPPAELARVALKATESAA